MRKNKAKFLFPEQKTAHLDLRSVSLLLDHPPKLPDALFEASRLISKRRLRKAFRLVEKCFKENPYNISLRIRYADCLLVQRRKEEALSLFNGYRDLTKAFPDAHSFFLEDYVAFFSFLGHLSLLEKNTEAAEEYHYLLYRLAKNDTRTMFLAKKIKGTQSIMSRLKNYFLLRFS